MYKEKLDGTKKNSNSHVHTVGEDILISRLFGWEQEPVL